MNKDDDFYSRFRDLTPPRKPKHPPLDPNGSWEQFVGRRCLLTDNYPWRGHAGEIVRIEKTPWGPRPVVRLDPGPKVPPGQECFVMKPEDFREA